LDLTSFTEEVTCLNDGSMLLMFVLLFELMIKTCLFLE
jgi:hypothetical protein